MREGPQGMAGNAGLHRKTRNLRKSLLKSGCPELHQCLMGVWDELKWNGLRRCRLACYTLTLCLKDEGAPPPSTGNAGPRNLAVRAVGCPVPFVLRLHTLSFVETAMAPPHMHTITCLHAHSFTHSPVYMHTRSHTHTCLRTHSFTHMTLRAPLSEIRGES